MANQFNRTELLLGKENMEKLSKTHILIFGVGGVGGYVVEALARSGIYHFTIVDNDTISETNINRQIIATEETLGQPKVEVMKKRILSINPRAKVNAKQMFFTHENAEEIDFNQFDCIVDAIDTIKSKLEIIQIADRLHKPIISSMGAGNKVNPMGFVVTDINKTDTDPLAKIIRFQLRKLGIKKLKVVYSKEQPIKVQEQEDGKFVPGSNAFVPSAAGLLIASEVVKDLIKDE